MDVPILLIMQRELDQGDWKLRRAECRGSDGGGWKCGGGRVVG